jgi:uncharacterized protein YxjI
LEINIGSNVFKNTNKILIVDGKEQISIETGQNDFQLLLTMEIYDSNGNHIAKLRRNSWVFNDKNRYEITTYPKSLKLIQKKTKETIIEINVESSTLIQILNGRFFTQQKQLCIITPAELRIGGVCLSGNTMDCCGAGVEI